MMETMWGQHGDHRDDMGTMGDHEDDVGKTEQQGQCGDNMGTTEMTWGPQGTMETTWG